MARMTIRDIARLAGVSVTTVSRALNNAPEINSQTRERVLQVCREQGYRSNLLARSLVSSRTRVLGVILPELSGPFHASIVLHLERYAQEQDYQIMLCCGRVGGSETAALFDFLVSHRVDGILLVSASSAAPDLLRRHARGTPSVLLGDVSPTATLQRINAVSTDNYVGGAMAAGYLSRLGHRRVLYLGPRRDSVTHVLRHQGFLTIARERGMEVETVFNPGAVSSAPNGYRLARQVFARPSRRRRSSLPPTPWPWVSSRRQTSWDWTFPAGSPCWAMTISNTPPCRKSASALWPSPPGPWQRALCGCCWS